LLLLPGSLQELFSHGWDGALHAHKIYTELLVFTTPEIVLLQHASPTPARYQVCKSTPGIVLLLQSFTSAVMPWQCSVMGLQTDCRPPSARHVIATITGDQHDLPLFVLTIF
jgi:hypothetical protein